MMSKALWKYLATGALAGIAYAIGEFASGVVMGSLHVKLPNLLPAGIDPMRIFLISVVVSLLLGVLLTPLAGGVGGTRLQRWAALFLLIFILLGVNGTFEIRIFSTLVPTSAMLPLMAMYVLPAVLCAAALSLLHAKDSGERAAGYFEGRSAGGWTLRFALAILAFPVCYVVFGMMVAPFVVPYYEKGVAGLLIPPMSIILPMQMLRSTLFLLASLPFLMLWRRSWWQLILALGLAHWAIVGLFGLLQATWLPVALRVGHSLEIGADSFAYAAALVFLLHPVVSNHRVTGGAQRVALTHP